jgi:hypothetical protein
MMAGMGTTITTEEKERRERLVVHFKACDGRDARG